MKAPVIFVVVTDEEPVAWSFDEHEADIECSRLIAADGKSWRHNVVPCAPVGGVAEIAKARP